MLPTLNTLIKQYTEVVIKDYLKNEDLKWVISILSYVKYVEQLKGNLKNHYSLQLSIPFFYFSTDNGPIHIYLNSIHQIIGLILKAES